MVLFTTPSSPAPQAGAPGPVVEAIRQGADATGTDFDYLLRTARRESSLDPAAKAPTSSATGLFQFIEQTWLGLVKSDGERVGLGAEAAAVTTRSDGTLTVADPGQREAILRLREEPQVASVLAGALTQQNRETLAGATGREPSAGELYMAHVLGARGAAGLIATASSDPARPAAADFPGAARANRAIFYERGGRPRGAGEVYSLLASAQADAAASPQPVRGATPAAKPAADPRPPGIYGLFQTGARTGPVSDAVARIWRGSGPSAGGDRAAGGASAFYPRSAVEAVDDEADVGASASGSVTVTLADAGMPAASAPTERAPAASVPLPPPRPRFLDIRPAGLAGAGTLAQRSRIP